MDCEPSSEMVKVYNMEEHSHVYEETQASEESLECKGSNSLTNIVFPSCEASGSSAMMIKLYHNDVTTKEQDLSEDPHLLKIPSVVLDDSDITPYQFDRHAPGRISTSPTLRRLRNTTSTISQVFPLQNGTESTRLHNQVSQSGLSLPLCPSSPPQPQHQLSSSYPELCRNPLSLQENSSQIDFLSVPPHREANFIHSQMVQKAKECKPYFQFEEKENSQDCVQVLDLHKPRGLYSLTERRHSSTVVSFPGLRIFPGDLLVSDSAAEFLHHSASLQSSESKKPWWPFSKKGSSKHKQVSDLKTCLSTVTIKMSECSGYEFQSVKDKTWHEIMKMYKPESKAIDDELDTKKTEALWELFTTECTYFLDHLLVLKTIFMDTLKYLQMKEFLPSVNSTLLFANLEELNEVSLSFVTGLFSAMKDHLVKLTPSADVISVLTKYFHGDLCQSHQTYCLNYTSAIFYLEKLKKREDFGIYLKWCEQNEHCRRLHLSELLVAPLHKLTRYPLLLKKIWKNTSAAEKIPIAAIKEKVGKSIRDLEGKVKWLDNYQKFKQLQEFIIWPSLWDQDKRFFVPDCLKHILKDNPNENILSPTKRFLVHEGKLTLAEHMKVSDVYVFLFDDLLLITKPNRHKKKSGLSDLNALHVCPFFSHELQSLLKEGFYCAVIDQPIPLDRLTVKNIDMFHLTVFGLQNAFLIQHRNRYQQCIAAFLLQAQTESIKKKWMSQMETAISNYTKRHNPLPAESAEI